MPAPVTCDRVFMETVMSEMFPGILTLKAPVTTAADNIHKYFLIVFQRK